MIPLTSGLKEMANQAAIVRTVAEEVFAEKEQQGRIPGRNDDRVATRRAGRRRDRARKPNSSASAPTI